MPTRRYTFCYYVSGHGFGHATRVCQIITELLKPTLTTTHPVANDTVDSVWETTNSSSSPAMENQARMEHRHMIYIVSDAPQFIFQDVIAMGAIYRNAKVDAGVVQPLAYSVDRQKTIEGVKTFLTKREELIRHEVAWLQKVGAHCVLADAPFLPCAAADACGIPACLITNFTFDEVYRFLREGDPLDKDVIACADAALEDYKKASLLLRLPGSIDIPAFEQEIQALESSRVDQCPVLPVVDFEGREEHMHQRKVANRRSISIQERSTLTVDVTTTLHSSNLTSPPHLSSPTSRPITASTTPVPHNRGGRPPRRAIDVPMVVRKAINTRQDILRALGVDDETIATKKMVLVSFGGQRLKQGWGNPLPEGWIGVICGLPVSHELPNGFYRSPHGVYVPDLTHAADIVIGKLGYGTCSECIAHDTALIYVSRPQFVEEHGLIKMMIKHGLPVEMTAEEFETGMWQRSILEADRLAREEKEGRRMFMEGYDGYDDHSNTASIQMEQQLQQMRDQPQRQHGQRHSLDVEVEATGRPRHLTINTSRRRSNSSLGSESKAKSLAESVNMGELARGGPLSAGGMDPEEVQELQHKHEQEMRARRSRSCSSVSPLSSRSAILSPLNMNQTGQQHWDPATIERHKMQESGLSMGINDTEGEISSPDRRSKASKVSSQTATTYLSEETAYDQATWFERRIPHNGGEICAKLIEEFMNEWLYSGQ